MKKYLEKLGVWYLLWNFEGNKGLKKIEKNKEN